MTNKKKRLIKKTTPIQKCDSSSAVSDSSLSSAPGAVEQASASIRKAAEEQYLVFMRESFGTEDAKVQSHLFDQIALAVPQIGQNKEMENLDFAIGVLNGIAPQDQLEGLLAVQMVAVHALAMECMRRAALPGQPDFGVDVYINRSTKLMRTFAAQSEALSRHRAKGEQKMTVEHVHVHNGGQAIVGQVSQNNSVTRDNSDEKQ